MTMLSLLAGLLFLPILIAWYSYRTAFYSPAKRKEDHYSIPKGEQYEKERQQAGTGVRAEYPRSGSAGPRKKRRNHHHLRQP